MAAKTVITWHVFGDGWDDWYNTLEQATRAFKAACKDKHANVRLYEETAVVGGDVLEENYLDGQGGYPY